MNKTLQITDLMKDSYPKHTENSKNPSRSPAQHTQTNASPLKSSFVADRFFSNSVIVFISDDLLETMLCDYQELHKISFGNNNPF